MRREKGLPQEDRRKQRQPSGHSKSKYCPLLSAFDVDIGNSKKGGRLCLYCPLEHYCIFDKPGQVSHEDWDKLLEVRDALIKVLEEWRKEVTV